MKYIDIATELAELFKSVGVDNMFALSAKDDFKHQKFLDMIGFNLTDTETESHEVWAWV
jgi:N-acetylglutamate synthase-like GNAT family acetyltransferase